MDEEFDDPSVSSDRLSVRGGRTVEHHHDVQIRRRCSTRAQYGVGEECQTALGKAFIHQTRRGGDWFHGLHSNIMFGIAPSITSKSGTSLNIRSMKATNTVDRVTSTDRVTDPGQSSTSADLWGRRRVMTRRSWEAGCSSRSSRRSTAASAPIEEEDLGPFAVGGSWSDCCLLYTSPSPRDRTRSRMPSSA